jgi:hypothetical protein
MITETRARLMVHLFARMLRSQPHRYDERARGPHSGPFPPGTSSATLFPLRRMVSSFVTRLPSEVISLQRCETGT